MRFHLAVSLAALALAGCSGGNETAPEPTTTTSEAVTEAVPASVESAPATPEAPAAASLPEPTPTPTPAPKPVPTVEPAAAASPEPAKVVEAAAPPAAFARCAVCHNAEKGAPDKIGPNLFGVYGKKAAQGSFNFSDAMKNAGLTLDEATLDKWIENPRALVPGNRMSFPGLKDEAKRQEIIAYLKQQR